MSLFSRGNAQDESVGVTLLIGEIRDLRSDMGKRDERIYDKIDKLEKNTQQTSQDVVRYQADVNGLRENVGGLTDSVKELATTVGEIKTDVDEMKTDKKVADNTWFGPKQARNIILIAATLTALGTIFTFGPKIAAAFATP